MSRHWDIDILFEAESSRTSSNTIRNFLSQVLAEIDGHGFPDSVHHVSVVLTTDDKIRELNRNYRGKDKPTDVLSFSQIEQAGEAHGPPPHSLGDIVISIDTAQKQAQELETPFSSELSRLLVHGLLHLLGFEHEGVPQETADMMFQKEDEILQKFQLSAPER